MRRSARLHCDLHRVSLVTGAALLVCGQLTYGADVTQGALQPFLFYQLGEGGHLRSTGVMAYNFDNDTYSVPFGFGLGKVIPTPKVVFNVFVEPQYSVADEGLGWPEWQVFIGLNSQFK
jgi:hypothetical protein